MKRSLTLPMLQIFDAPDTATSCARRETSTVAPQALALMNSEFTCGAGRAVRGADPQAGRRESRRRPWRRDGGSRSGVHRRRKSAQTALEYLQRNSLPRLCLLMFNMSEFIYVD